MTHPRRLSLIIATLLATAPSYFAQSFAPPVSYAVGTNPFATAVADFNGDSRLDLAVANNLSQNVSVLLGRQDGTFEAKTDYDVGAGPYAVTIADFDSDGKQDIATSNSFSNVSNVSILLGLGDGTFQPRSDYALSEFALPNSIAAGDLNGDGKPDLVTANQGGGSLSVLLNRGDGTFNSPVNYTIGTFPTSVALADFNQDGKRDVAVSNYGGSIGLVTIRLGHGDGSFSTPASYEAGPGPYALTSVDVDHDDKLDLVTGNIGGSSVGVLRGNGDGTFASAVYFAAGNSPFSIAAADINADGKIDIALANNGGTLNILAGNGDGSFGRPANYLVGSVFVTVAEINNDGKPDLVSAGSNSVIVLINQTGPHSISGTITETYNTALSGVTVTLTGAAPMFSTTGLDSTFAFSGLATGGNYVVTPSKPNITFIPPNRTFNNLTTDQTTNFMGSISRYVVSGVIRDRNGVGVKNALVSLTGAISDATLTAADGSYSFSAVPGGGNYTISATLGGYLISPPTLGILNLSASRTINFTAVPSNSQLRISGAVRNTSTGHALFGAYLSLDGSKSRLTFPSSEGNYFFSDLEAGGTYVVSVTTFRPGVSFSNSLLTPPFSQTFTNLTSDGIANFFGMTLDYEVSSYPTGIASGDFNSDGKLDLASSSGGTNGLVSVLLGKGSGAFENPMNFTVGCNPLSILTADLNNDGKLDLATVNSCHHSVSVLLGNGDGTFRAAANYSVDTAPVALTLGDFNGDGNQDLVTASSNIDFNLSVLLGIGDGTFANATKLPSIRISSLVSGDFNGDGKLDLAATNFDANSVSVIFGSGNGTFQPATVLPVGSLPFRLAVGDLNGDTKLDLVATTPGSSTVSVLLSRGNGLFDGFTTFAAGVSNRGVKIADFNGDNKPDLAVANFDGSVATTLMGNGDGTFQSPSSSRTEAGNPFELTTGDFNGDGKIDLAFTIFYSNKVSVLLNSISGLGPVKISGQAKTAAGEPISGATVTLAGSQTGTALTDASGNYTFDGLAAGGTYTITPGKTFYTFSPQGQTFNNVTGNQVCNFIASLENLGIVGRVTDSNGAGLAGVAVTMSGSHTRSAVTNANGTYTFFNLPAGGNYVVTPSFTSGTFIPTNRTFNNLSFTTVADFRSSLTRTIQFDSAAFNVSEGAESALITLTRAGDLSAEASVDYATSDGTANQGRDYTTTSGRISFGPGETSKSFTVLVTDNVFVDGNRSVNLILSNPTGSTFAALSTSILTITDNDTASPTGNPIDNAQFFVRQHYYDFLSRIPDQGGLDYWSSQISNCNDDPVCINSRRVGVSAAYFIELEFQDTGAFVYRFYKASYGQRPIYPRFMPDRSRVVAGANLEAGKQAFADSWVQRPEFVARYPVSLTGSQFIDALLQTVQQGSGMDLSSQRTALIDDYNQNQSRARIVRLIVDNPTFKDTEYNRAFVLMQYFGYLRRDPDEGGYQFWLDVLNNRVPGNFRGMVCAFITSGEYQARFSFVRTRTDSVCGEIP